MNLEFLGILNFVVDSVSQPMSFSPPTTQSKIQGK